MALFAITAIRIDPRSNRITHARMGQFDAGTNKWMTEPAVVEALDVAAHLMKGDTVHSIHEIEGGHTVPGAKARRVVFQDGSEGFDTREPHKHPGRTMRDLPHF